MKTPPVDLEPGLDTVLCRISSRVVRILGRQRSRNFWPPKPGSTDMISTMSSGQQGLLGPIEVAGLRAMPARAPCPRSSLVCRTGAVADSTWTVMWAPRLGEVLGLRVGDRDHQVRIERHAVALSAP